MAEGANVHGTPDLTPERIRAQRFDLSDRGYAPAAVDEYLEQVASAMEVLREQPGPMAVRAELERVSASTSRLVMAAQEAGERLQRQAAEEAEEILTDARSLATELRQRAQDESARTSRHVSDIRETFVQELRDLYDRVGATLYRLEQAGEQPSAGERLERSLAGIESTPDGGEATSIDGAGSHQAAAEEPSDAQEPVATDGEASPTAGAATPAAEALAAEPAADTDGPTAHADELELEPHPEDPAAQAADEPLVDLRGLARDEPAATPAPMEDGDPGDGAATDVDEPTPDAAATDPAVPAGDAMMSQEPSEPGEPAAAGDLPAAEDAGQPDGTPGPDGEPGSTEAGSGESMSGWLDVEAGTGTSEPAAAPAAEVDGSPTPEAGEPADITSSAIWGSVGDDPAAPADPAAAPPEWPSQPAADAAPAAETAPAAEAAPSADDDVRAEALLEDMDRILGDPEGGDTTPESHLLSGLVTDWPATHQFILQQVSQGADRGALETYLRDQMGAHYPGPLIDHVVGQAQAAAGQPAPPPAGPALPHFEAPQPGAVEPAGSDEPG